MENFNYNSKIFKSIGTHFLEELLKRSYNDGAAEDVVYNLLTKLDMEQLDYLSDTITINKLVSVYCDNYSKSSQNKYTEALVEYLLLGSCRVEHIYNCDNLFQVARTLAFITDIKDVCSWCHFLLNKYKAIPINCNHYIKTTMCGFPSVIRICKDEYLKIIQLYVVGDEEIINKCSTEFTVSDSKEIN